ncbi:MAG: DUF1566 domain-containing protein [Armatimonadota bacterium]|jgi:hypothetical protein
MRGIRTILCSALAVVLISGCGGAPSADAPASALTYPIVGTAQTACYDATGEIDPPGPREPFRGQDAQQQSAPPGYRDNGDGTVTDLVTGLMWQRDPGEKVTWQQAMDAAATLDLAGHTDWRVPSIKELYSLIRFDGYVGRSPQASVPYIDTSVFVFSYGDEAVGDRFIDSQFCSSTEYVGAVFEGIEAIFGVNFADGRIKGYPKGRVGPRQKTYFCLYVRGNPAYGVNDFVDNGDGTITDRATGLMWLRDDSVAYAAGPREDGLLNWQEALAWAEQLTLAGHEDWRLPTAKELQSLVDYTRAPAVTGSPAIAPLFNCSPIVVEDGATDFGFYWTSTTHLSGRRPGDAACYVAFGSAPGFMRGRWMDVHGAGAQRSDPKSGDPSFFPQGRGPQGDAIRIVNPARCVRDAD